MFTVIAIVCVNVIALGVILIVLGDFWPSLFERSRRKNKTSDALSIEERFQAVAEQLRRRG